MNRVSLLIGDGNLDFLNALRFFLHRHTREGLEVVGLATDDSELLAKAHALRPRIVVLNLRMALLSSLNVIPALRKVVPNIRAILLTSSRAKVIARLPWQPVPMTSSPNYICSQTCFQRFGG